MEFCIKNTKLLPLTSIFLMMIHDHFLGQAAAGSKLDYALVTLQEYCDSYAENMKPLICVIKDNKFVTVNPNLTTTTTESSHSGWGWGWTESWRRPPPPRRRPHPPPRRPPPPPPPPGHFQGGWQEGWHESSESEETTDCSCDLTCLPRPLPLPNNNDTFTCKQCGSDCDVKTGLNPTCTCLGFSGGSIIGRSVESDGSHPRIGRQGGGGMTLPCNCTVTCARRDRKLWGWGHHQEEVIEHHYIHHHVEGGWPFCIFNVNGLQTFSPISLRSMTCECCKSQTAMNNRIPDFVCVCQPK